DGTGVTKDVVEAAVHFSLANVLSMQPSTSPNENAIGAGPSSKIYESALTDVTRGMSSAETRDLETRFKVALERVADAGNAIPLWLVAGMYLDSTAVPGDSAKAVESLRRA